jgi:hypothetical protein
VISSVSCCGVTSFVVTSFVVTGFVVTGFVVTSCVVTSFLCEQLERGGWLLGSALTMVRGE